MSSNPFFIVILNFLVILKSKTMRTSPRVIFSSSNSDLSQVIIDFAMAVSLHVVIKSSTYTPIVLCTCLSACHLLNMHGSYGFCTYHNFPDSVRPYRAFRHSAVSLPYIAQAPGTFPLTLLTPLDLFLLTRAYAPTRSAIMTVRPSCAAVSATM